MSFTNVFEVYISLIGVNKLTKNNYELLAQSLANGMKIQRYRVLTDPELLPELVPIQKVTIANKLRLFQTNGDTISNASTESNNTNLTNSTINQNISSNSTVNESMNFNKEGVPYASPGNYLFKFMIFPENKDINEISSWRALQNLYEAISKIPNSGD